MGDESNLNSPVSDEFNLNSLA